MSLCITALGVSMWWLFGECLAAFLLTAVAVRSVSMKWLFRQCFSLHGYVAAE